MEGQGRETHGKRQNTILFVDQLVQMELGLLVIGEYGNEVGPLGLCNSTVNMMRN